MTTSGTDTAATFVRQTVQDIFSAAVPVAESAIIAAAPFMATPVLMQVWEELFKIIIDEFSKALGEEASFLVMDVQTFIHVTTAAQAITKLKAAQAAGDLNAITQAATAADLAAQKLLSYIGDAHP